MALLLPSTFALDPATALIMLAGIYYGAMYGGSTTSILVNVPGEAGSVVTLLDGYQMTRKGRAGAALAVAAVGSFVAGTVGVAGVLVLAEEGAVRAQIASVRLRELFPTREEWRRSAAPIARGSVVGFLTGLIPGPAAVLSTFISYALEKRVSKTPEKFGTGM